MKICEKTLPIMYYLSFLSLSTQIALQTLVTLDTNRGTNTGAIPDLHLPRKMIITHSIVVSLKTIRHCSGNASLLGIKSCRDLTAA